MKSSERPLLIVPAVGPVNKKRRYFNMRNALKKAVELTVEEKTKHVIYDISRGVDIVTVIKRGHEVTCTIHAPKTFNHHWST